VSAQLETENWRRQVSTLAAFGGQALRAQDVGELLQEATRLVSEAIEVDLVKVLEPIANGQELLVRAGVNWNPGVVGRWIAPQRSCRVWQCKVRPPLLSRRRRSIQPRDHYEASRPRSNGRLFGSRQLYWNRPDRWSRFLA
jgi:hypothetical protein